VRDLGYSPHNTIVVTLYTGQAFFDVTRAPSWVGAINDGKLRIPISGVTSMTPDLAHVLKHELAHSFITQMSGGRCPAWLHEGIAQLEEGKSIASYGRLLAQLFGAEREIPYNVLEGSFMQFSSEATPHAESLAAAEYSAIPTAFSSANPGAPGTGQFHRSCPPIHRPRRLPPVAGRTRALAER
jgi:hypothetical protein